MQEAQQEEEDRLEAEALAREQFEDQSDRRWFRQLREKRCRQRFEREERERKKEELKKELDTLVQEHKVQKNN